MSRRLHGRVAIVSGAARGIGAAVAQAFATEGARVLVTDVRVEEGESTARAIRGIGGQTRFQRLDVRRHDDWKAAVRTAEDAFGPVDLLVSNAFVMAAPALADTSPEQWEASLQVNLHGAVNGIQAVLPGMVARRSGSIVVVSATQGNDVWVPANAAYQAAKAALSSVVRHVAVTYGRDGVRANAIHPGAVDTEMLAEEGQRDLALAAARVFPLPRLGKPTDVAAAALYLASEESAYVTGSTLVVDGGASVGAVPPTAADDTRGAAT